ncbi:AAA family ATPase [Azospira oryzae]|uniref:AAA family ATPase n=1 Tax=Azospira oryzae TaxID=146939 RepID=UPI001964CFEF|nr:TniB family NTP-binding protein [Azospira oryzae]
MTHKNIQPALTPVPASAESLLNLRIKHTRIKQVIDELNTLIYPGSQDSILLVIGPTGVGKSTLARYMVEQAMEGAMPEMNSDAGLIPAVYVEAPSSGEDDFSWRLFYTQALVELGEDLSAPKVAYGIDPTTGRMVRPRGMSHNGLAGLRTAVERCLKERDTRFVVIDEAAHIIRQTRRSRLEIQLDTLKSLANKGSSQMVMVGSYDLYQLVSLSGQLARRIHVVHCERYRQDRPEDVLAFTACLQKFQSVLPHLWGDQLVQYAQALHENTLGCVGTLSSVLTRAAKLAEADGRWTVGALERALLTDAQRTRILEEILEGEAAINPSLTRNLPRIKTTTPRNNREVA